MKLYNCHTCNLGIEMRYSVSVPRSKRQGYWAYLETEAGVAADQDRQTLR